MPVLGKILAGGGVAAAVTASTCCVLPLSLTALGVGTAWLPALLVLAPYRTAFLVTAILMLGAAFWLVYRPRQAAADGAACVAVPSQRGTRTLLWVGAFVVGAAATSGWWERFVV
jgi:mercuric ion transport protein